MSEPAEMTIKSNAQLDDEYYRSEEEEYEEFKEFRKEKLRRAGIKISETELGESVHPGTLKSYRDLGMEVPDNVRLATLRPSERLKQHLLALDQKVKIYKIIRNVSRIKDESTENDEYMVYSFAEIFRDPNGNLRKLEYTREGAHEEIYGDKKIDHSFRQTGFEPKGKKLVFDIPWDPKQFEELMKIHNASVSELKKQRIDEIEQPSLVVGYGKNNSHDIFTKGKKKFAIKNAEDFQHGKFEELYQLGQRALSSATPSLKKLSQPVSEDPSSSLHKREKGYLPPSVISYTQQSYR